MSESTIMVEEAKVQDGVSQRTGKPYKRLVVKDGNGDFYSTFESGLFEPAQALEGKRAKIQWEQDGNFKTLKAIRQTEEPPTPGTGNYITGQKPPIEVRRMCALNSATNATAMTAELLRYQTSQQITPELYRAAWDAMYDHAFLKSLRACRAIEDEDIPF